MIVYTDLDGTLLGAGGSLLRTEDGALTLEPASALHDLLAAGHELVLVSGRTSAQLAEAARILGAGGFIGELGAVLGWRDPGDHVWSQEVLRGDTPAGHPGSPFEVMVATGAVDALLDRYVGALEWHAPWHDGHEADAMLRGRVDTAEAAAFLAAAGHGWLALHDNGALPVDGAPHVYHLMPRGLTKGTGVGRDLARRGVDPSAAVAIGDSVSDLAMAPEVGRMFLVANGARVPAVADVAAAAPGVVVTAAAMGLGWAEAVRAVLATT